MDELEFYQTVTQWQLYQEQRAYLDFTGEVSFRNLAGGQGARIPQLLTEKSK